MHVYLTDSLSWCLWSTLLWMSHHSNYHYLYIYVWWWRTKTVPTNPCNVAILTLCSLTCHSASPLGFVWRVLYDLEVNRRDCGVFDVISLHDVILYVWLEAAQILNSSATNVCTQICSKWGDLCLGWCDQLLHMEWKQCHRKREQLIFFHLTILLFVSLAAKHIKQYIFMWMSCDHRPACAVNTCRMLLYVSCMLP